MGTVKQFADKWKESVRKKAVDAICDSFAVTERGGDLWLTHYGVAFKRIDKDTAAHKVTALLNEVRRAAIDFEKA